MLTYSNNFKFHLEKRDSENIKETATIEIGGVETDINLLNLPSVSTSIDIDIKGRIGKSNNLKLIVDNAEKQISPLVSGSIFYGDKIFNNIGRLKVGFASGTNVLSSIYGAGIYGAGVYCYGLSETEQLTQFTGELSKLSIKREKANITLVDKFADFLDKELATKDRDLEPTGTDTYVIDWTTKSPGWVIWALLTGYDYDTDLQLSWYETSKQFDNTKSSANADIDFDRFEKSDLFTNGIDLTGGFYNNETIAAALEKILEVSFGNISVDYSTGKIKWVVWQPDPTYETNNYYTFDASSTKDIYNLIDCQSEYDRKNIINQVVIKYDYDSATDSYQKNYVINSVSSISDYGVKELVIETQFLVSDTDVQTLAERTLERYKNPLVNVTINTDLSPIILELNDFIRVTDDSTGLDDYLFEVIGLQKNFAQKKCQVKAYDASIYQLDAGERWGFFWDTNSIGDGNGGDGSVAFTSTDYDNDTGNARNYSWFSGDIPSENLGYVFF